MLTDITTPLTTTAAQRIQHAPPFPTGATNLAVTLLMAGIAQTL